MVNAYIGLGSNLEDPVQQVQQALTELDQLRGCRLLQQSPLYGSSPVGPQDQPDYVNAVALLETRLSPHELLDVLQQLEQQHRRRREQRWGPRTLDLDLLLYGQDTISDDRLQVPHPRMGERSFVLYPLADINANLMLPSGISLREALSLCPRAGLWPIETEGAAPHGRAPL